MILLIEEIWQNTWDVLTKKPGLLNGQPDLFEQSKGLNDVIDGICFLAVFF